MNRHVTMNLHDLLLHFGLWRAMLEMDVACGISVSSLQELDV